MTVRDAKPGLRVIRRSAFNLSRPSIGTLLGRVSGYYELVWVSWDNSTVTDLVHLSGIELLSADDEALMALANIGG